jgi:hypothetical protein
VTIVPDTKDWTWVLSAPCPECGFRASSFARDEIPARLRANVDAWRAVFAGSDDLRVRPRPDKWSPLEYGCHVRDVFRLYAYRLELMLTEDDPAYPNWDQDETAVKERYGEQDPAAVKIELAAAGDRLADAFEAVHSDQWLRTGSRSDGARFTVESFARYLLHDPVHHLYDVTGQPFDPTGRQAR